MPVCEMVDLCVRRGERGGETERVSEGRERERDVFEPKVKSSLIKIPHNSLHLALGAAVVLVAAGTVAAATAD